MHEHIYIDRHIHKQSEKHTYTIIYIHLCIPIIPIPMYTYYFTIYFLFYVGFSGASASCRAAEVEWSSPRDRGDQKIRIGVFRTQRRLKEKLMHNQNPETW